MVVYAKFEQTLLIIKSLGLWVPGDTCVPNLNGPSQQVEV